MFKTTALRWLFFAITCLFSTAIIAEELIVYSLPEAQANKPIAERLSWQFPQSQYVLLNGQWDIKTPQTNQFAGNIRVPFSFVGEADLLLEKRLKITVRDGFDYHLHMGVIVGNAKIWFNDSLVYSGNQNYLPVNLKIPATFIQPENIVRVEIASQKRRRGDLPGFYPVNLPRIDYGLLDGVYLSLRPRRNISEIDFSAAVQDSGATFAGNVLLSQSFPDSLGYRILLRGFAGERQIFEQQLPVNNTNSVSATSVNLEKTIPWSPKTPQQFWVETVLDSAGKTIDIHRQRVAVRSAAMSGNDFLLNQQPQLLEGINYLYQNREGSSLLDPALIRQDLQDIKQRGFTAIRMVLHPMPEWFYNICDENGLLVLQDLPFVMWNRDTESQQRMLQNWQEYGEYLAKLSRKYSAVAAVGPAFYPNLVDPLQRKRMEIITEDLRKQFSIPLYLSSMLPEGDISNIDFQLIDILGRRLTARNVQRSADALNGQPFFPSAFSKSMTFRIDSTIIAQDLLLAQELYRQLKSGELPVVDRGNFIQTYTDFYLYLPSIQNGLTGNFYLNRIGLVDLKRQPRDLDELRRRQEFATSSPVGMIREDQGSHSFLYIIIGFMNIFVFLITYRRYKVFRQSVAHSIKKPHGFFINLQERIIIPYKQSLFILVVLALNGALVYSAFLYFYRNHLLADYLLSLIFFTPWLKDWAIRMVWDQTFSIIVSTVSIVLFFYMLALFIKLFSFFGRSRVLFNQALAVTIWAASPFVFLLPLGVFIYSMLLMMKSYWIIIGVLLYFHVWVYLRWINGARVLTDKLYGRVFLAITFVLLILAGAFGYFYESYYHVLQHGEFLKALKAFWK